MADDPKSGNPLDFGFGELNPIEPPSTAKSYTRSDTKFLPAVRKAIRDAFTPDAITGNGPYKALVLRVEEEPDSDVGIADWLVGMFDGQKSNAPTLVRIKAMIPELYPFPIDNGDGNSDGPHQQDIDMFPTFCAQSDLVPEPAVGEYVWVDFGNKTNLTDPIYIRPVLEKEGMSKALGIDKLREALAKIGCGGGLGVGGSSGDSAGGANRGGASHKGPPRGARAQSVGEPKTIRGPDAEESWCKLWEERAEANGIPMISHWSRLPSNGMRDLLVFAPLTTDFSKPVELAYIFHGAKSWLDSESWTGENGIYSKVLKQMILDGRNIIFVHPNLPWSLKKHGGAGGDNRTLWNGDKGGDLTALHGDVLNIIKTHFSAEVNITYLSITSHSKGIDGLVRAVKNGDHLMALKPDKITHGDVYGAHGAFESRKIVHEGYVAKAGKYVEVNDITQILGKADSGDAAVEFFQKVLGESVPGKGTKQIAKGNFTYNYDASTKSHNALAFDAVAYLAPAPPAPPAASGGGGDAKAFDGNVSLSLVSMFGTSMIGADAEPGGQMGRAATDTLNKLGAGTIANKGVWGSNIRQWLGDRDFRANGSPPAPKAAQQFNGGQSGVQIMSTNPSGDGNKPTLYWIAISNNECHRGETEAKIQGWLDDCKKLLDIMSPDKSIPVVWTGHVYDGGDDISLKCQNMYKAMDEKLVPEYKNLLFLWPNTDPLKEIYLSHTRKVNNFNAKLHPPKEVHQKFLDARMGEITKFLGVGASAGSTPPEDNKNASPTPEKIPAESNSRGDAGGDEELAQVCHVINDILQVVMQSRVNASQGILDSNTDTTQLIDLIAQLDHNATYIEQLKNVYQQLQADQHVSENTSSLEPAPTLEIALSQIVQDENALDRIEQLLRPRTASDSGTSSLGDVATCRNKNGEFVLANLKNNPDGTNKTNHKDGEKSNADDGSPSERAATSSTEEESEKKSSGESIKFLDLLEDLSTIIGLPPKLFLAIMRIESGGVTFCPSNGKPIVRFEPHLVFKKDFYRTRWTVSDADAEKAKQLPWHGCGGTSCKSWKDFIGFTGGSRTSRCEAIEKNFKGIPVGVNWDEEYEKGIVKSIKAIEDLGIPNLDATEVVYMASSFGAGQTMGFLHDFGKIKNTKIPGLKYDSAKDLVKAYMASEVEQIRGLYAFVEGKPGMVSAARKCVQSGDCMKLGNLYNGCKPPNCRWADKMKDFLNSTPMPENRELINDASQLPSGTGGSAIGQGSRSSGGSAGTSCGRGGGGGSGGSGGGGGLGSVGGAKLETKGDFVAGNYAPPNPDGLYPSIKPSISGNWRSLMAVYGPPKDIASNLVTINFLGASKKVHRLAQDAFKKVNDEINALRGKSQEVANYKFVVGGTFVPRCIKNRTSKHPECRPPKFNQAAATKAFPNCGNCGVSTHAYGLAIDINATTNPYSTKAQGLITDIPKLVVGAFKRYGFKWGGDWNNPDAMHFEWRGDPGERSDSAGEVGSLPGSSDDDAAANSSSLDDPANYSSQPQSTDDSSASSSQPPAQSSGESSGGESSSSSSEAPAQSSSSNCDPSVVSCP